MKKIKAIWRIITSDYFFVATYEHCHNDSIWMTADYFHWVLNSTEDYFLDHVTKLINFIKKEKDENKEI